MLVFKSDYPLYITELVEIVQNNLIFILLFLVFSTWPSVFLKYFLRSPEILLKEP